MLSLSQILILLIGADEAQVKGIVHGTWYHAFIISLYFGE